MTWLDDLTWWLDRNSGLTWLDRDLTWNKFFPLTWLETWLDLKKAGLNTYRGVQAAWLDDLTWWLDRNSGLTWLDRDLTWNKFFPLTWLETWLDLKKAGLNTYRGVQAGLTWWLDLMTWLNSDLTWLDHDLTWQNFWALDLTWGLTWLEKSDLNTPTPHWLDLGRVTYGRLQWTSLT